MAIVAVIPARMGSKTIPNKNFSELQGRSLIEISANAAKAITNEWFVSSESSLVQSFCVSRGYPYLRRPPELANDL
ncbi:MAG: pseudaminic acid cytidylyltransferase, partial [Burkholderiaceae bacterium]